MEHSKSQKKARDAFEKAYDTYGSDIFRFCVLKVATRDIAQDITQDVFMRYWQSIRTGTSIKNERAYLYTLARNLVIDWYRKKKALSLDMLAEEGIEFSDSSFASLTGEAEGQIALKALATLDEDSREVVSLRLLEGLHPREIAQIRNESANVVSVRLNRALKKLKGELHISHD